MRGTSAVNRIAAPSVIQESQGAGWRLLRGESFKILRELPDASVDAIVTDPPYSSGGQFRGDRSKLPSEKYQNRGIKVERVDFDGDTRDQRSFLAWCTLWLFECLRVAKRGSPICVFSDWRQVPIMTDALQAAGWVWRGIAPWDKCFSRPVLGRFNAQSEFVIWGSAGQMPIKRAGIGALPGVFRHQVLVADKHHMTGKPTPLMREIARIVDLGGIVLDPFAGSSSTGIGALREGRQFLGIEQSQYYYDVSRLRLERWRIDDAEYLGLLKKLRKRKEVRARKSEPAPAEAST